VPLELLQQQQATQRMFTIVTGAIAGISLLVGGIGIMNIMLANIYERTKEIGTLRALGGKKRTILLNFMLESMALTGCGGVLGLLLGFVIASLIERYAGMQTIVSPLSVAAALVVSVLTGLIFGSYPAWKAASLNPIEALRR
jgi:putative ABC transport system permease protein